MYKAEILADSLSPTGDRLTTMKVTFPRIVLAEFNTHRMFSRNSASSRAIPFKKMVEMVQEKPFIPIAWQKDHKGMQGNEYFSSELPDGFSTTRAATDILEKRWLWARDFAVMSAKELYKAGSEDDRKVSKQLCNRLLEPFMWHTVIVSATHWDNFFKLRCPKYTFDRADYRVFRSKKTALDFEKEGSIAKDLLKKYSLIDWLTINKSQADIHIQAIAELMWDAYNSSNPKQLKEGEWHIPFGDKLDNISLVEVIKIATARCARISYQTFGDKPAINHKADLKLHDMLVKSKHWSPLEHIARTMKNNEYESYYRGEGANHNHTGIKANQGWCKNFKGFIQYRHIQETTLNKEKAIKELADVKYEIKNNE